MRSAKLDYPKSFRDLVEELRRLPGIGPRGAERIALWMFRSSHASPKALSRAIEEAAAHLKMCKLCGFFAHEELCALCNDQDCSNKELCVVEVITDILPLERTGAFHGRYHALGGKLSPLNGIGPEQLRIRELMDRLVSETPSEIILALGADLEGEATAHYLAELLVPKKIKVTRLAQGLPAGGGIEYADQRTLERALIHRSLYQN